MNEKELEESKAVIKIYEERDYGIYKANDIVRRARYDLSIAQLKALAFILSKIKKFDPPGLTYKFSIKEYCRVCGIEERSGGNYADVKKNLKSLRDTSFWLMDETGKETTVGWLDKVRINKGSGKVEVKLDEDLQKYVIGVFEDFTQYSLIYTLPMRSAYSFRMYELLKSYEFQHEHTFDIDDLKKQLMAEHYKNFKDFRMWVIEVATREINLYTDIEIQWQPIKKGRRVAEVKFDIIKKSSNVDVSSENNTLLDGQLTLNDFNVHGKTATQDNTIVIERAK